MDTGIQHIAIIPDGNRRWAKQRGMLPWLGHKTGISGFRELTNAVFHKGIPYLTYWALSIDNLSKRPAVELDFLFNYLKAELGKPETVQDFIDHDVQVRIVGKWRELLKDQELIAVLNQLEEKTQAGSKFHLTILFVYDGTVEMMDAMTRLDGKELLDYAKVKQSLWTGFLPEVNLVIRTGGEPHWSGGFMMWLTRDSQFYFTDKKFPEFNEQELDIALADYSGRELRRGK